MQIRAVCSIQTAFGLFKSRRLTSLLFSRHSAYLIEFAMQIHKNREHVSRFLYPKREKVSVWELSDDFGTACGPFLLVGETVVSRQQTVRQYHIILQSNLSDDVILPCI